MSTSLFLQCDPVDQPAADDPVERQSWCALSIRISGRTVTRVWDRVLQRERSLLYLPAFPIAEWIVANWWLLLNEPCPTPDVPQSTGIHLPWINRHCLRCADSGLLLPALYLFNDGRGIGIEWQADLAGALPHMPGEFVDGGRDHLDSVLTEDALGEFVDAVLARISDLQDERVQTTLSTWSAIRNADVEERSFCIAAARLGINPYNPEQMPGRLASFLETDLGDPEQPLVRDLTEATDADSIADQWSWVRKTIGEFHLGPGLVSSMPPPSATGSPFLYGYRLATLVRQKAGLDPVERIDSVSAVAMRVDSARLTTPVQEHVSSQDIRAVVGWTPNHGLVIAGPRPSRNDSQRFLDARGLYHGLFTCNFSQRLVTKAFTWDQQASRAFAAELLAPRTALLARVSQQVDHGIVDELAQEFATSRKVIENQLENAGVTVIEE